MDLDIETRDKVVNFTHYWLKRASDMFQQELSERGVSLPKVDVDFNQRGQIAATAKMYPDENDHIVSAIISYNPYHVTKDINEIYYNIVPHEVAHIVTGSLYGNVKPHGPEWASVMKRFGVKPEVTTDVVVMNPPTRKRNLHLYKCIGCGHQKVLTNKEALRAEEHGLECENCGEPMFQNRKVTL